MSNYNSLKSTINANIKTNGNQEITGSVLNSVLNAMVSTLGDKFQFGGIITPETTITTGDAKVAYIGGEGTYNNAGGNVVAEGYLGVFMYNGSWSVQSVKVGTNYDDQISQLQQEIFENKMTTAAKSALMALFRKVAYAYPDVSAEVSALESALFDLSDVVRITATYTQGNTIIYSDGVSTLNDLRANLVVKAVYGNGTEVEIQDYTLTGSLNAGTSTIRVNYGIFTTTFNVSVTQYGSKMSYTMSLGEIAMYDGYPSGNASGYGYIVTSSTNRKGFAMTKGKVKVKDGDGNDTIYYPIPVPQNATKVTLQVTAATLQVAIRSLYLHNGEYYNAYDHSAVAAATINPGWWTGSGSYDFSNAPNNREELYLLVNCKLANGGTFTNSNKPTNLVITFE